MRLLLADDHNLFREALCFYLGTNSPDVEVTEAASLGEALDRASSTAFDAIVLDLCMPGMNGLDGITTMRARAPSTPIVILSGNITRSQADEAVARGAAGVISKDLSGRALVTALKLVLAGEVFISSSVLGGEKAAREVSRTAERQDRQELGNLTRRELEVIKHLARGIDVRDIARDLDVAEVTIRLHLHNAMKKMGARNRADAVRIAITKGIAAS
jgi:DNA-binding NarL/FixJ family response regulator